MNNLTEVSAFLTQCLQELGLGFHPDTPMTEYVEVGFFDDSTKYEPDEAWFRQKQLDACHAWCQDNDTDIYFLTMSLPAFQELKKPFDKGYDPELAAMGAYTT